jgi:hypothetical protein
MKKRSSHCAFFVHGRHNEVHPCVLRALVVNNIYESVPNLNFLLILAEKGFTTNKILNLDSLICKTYVLIRQVK